MARLLHKAIMLAIATIPATTMAYQPRVGLSNYWHYFHAVRERVEAISVHTNGTVIYPVELSIYTPVVLRDTNGALTVYQATNHVITSALSNGMLTAKGGPLTTNDLWQYSRRDWWAGLDGVVTSLVTRYAITGTNYLDWYAADCADPLWPSVSDYFASVGVDYSTNSFWLSETWRLTWPDYTNRMNAILGLYRTIPASAWLKNTLTNSCNDTDWVQINVPIPTNYPTTNDLLCVDLDGVVWQAVTNEPEAAASLSFSGMDWDVAYGVNITNTIVVRRFVGNVDTATAAAMSVTTNLTATNVWAYSPGATCDGCDTGLVAVVEAAPVVATNLSHGAYITHATPYEPWATGVICMSSLTNWNTPGLACGDVGAEEYPQAPDFSNDLAMDLGCGGTISEIYEDVIGDVIFEVWLGTGVRTYFDATVVQPPRVIVEWNFETGKGAYLP